MREARAGLTRRDTTLLLPASTSHRDPVQYTGRVVLHVEGLLHSWVHVAGRGWSLSVTFPWRTVA
jgi:hypothetical protein